MNEAFLNYPTEMTPAVRAVLSQMCFEFIDLARLWRETGTPIDTAAEAEQAYFLHWMLCLALLYGDDWRKKAGEEIQRRISLVKSNAA